MHGSDGINISDVVNHSPSPRDFKRYLQEPMSGSLQFSDLNFKLAVVQVLMYEKGLLEPSFRIRDFASKYFNRKIDVNAEGYSIIPEALDWFERLPISTSLAGEVVEIYQDGGNEIYLEIFPFWDGECDSFNIQSVEDARQFPSLKKVTVFYDEQPRDGIVAKLRDIGLEAEYL